MLLEELADEVDHLAWCAQWVCGWRPHDKRVCAICGAPATCLGRYEDMHAVEYACDEHCGHGCEDGLCVRFADDSEDE